MRWWVGAEPTSQKRDPFGKLRAGYVAPGGVAYLISKAIHSARVLAFADLGMEAIYEFDVVDMPVTVAVDSLGSSVHTTGPAEWQSRIAQHLPNTAILQ